jgi:hypothetical protein
MTIQDADRLLSAQGTTTMLVPLVADRTPSEDARHLRLQLLVVHRLAELLSTLIARRGTAGDPLLVLVLLHQRAGAERPHGHTRRILDLIQGPALSRALGRGPQMMNAVVAGVLHDLHREVHRLHLVNKAAAELGGTAASSLKDQEP